MSACQGKRNFSCIFGNFKEFFILLGDSGGKIVEFLQNNLKLMIFLGPLTAVLDGHRVFGVFSFTPGVKS